MSQVTTCDNLAADPVYLPVTVTVNASTPPSLNFAYRYHGKSYNGPQFRITDYRASKQGPAITAPLLITFSLKTPDWFFTAPSFPDGSHLAGKLLSSSVVTVLDPATDIHATWNFNLHFQKSKKGESYSHDPQVTNDPSVDPPP